MTTPSTSTPAVSLLGWGPRAITLAGLATLRDHEVCVWPKETFRACEENVPTPQCAARLKLAASLEALCAHAKLLFLVGPPAPLDKELAGLAPYLGGDHQILTSVGGLLPGDSREGPVSMGCATAQPGIKGLTQRISEITCVKQTGALWGACLGSPPRWDQPAGWVVASRFPRLRETAKAALTANPFRVYESDDTLGVTLAAGLTPLYELACGMGRGMEMGEAGMGLLLARSVAEIARFGTACGADTATFSGLSCLGALASVLAAPTSPLLEAGQVLVSRERAKNNFGKTKASAPNHGPDHPVETLEATVEVVAHAARARRIPMPILFGLQRLLDGDAPPHAIVSELASLEVGREQDVTVDPSRLGVPLPALEPVGGPGKGPSPR